jgi:hypothetical protein
MKRRNLKKIALLGLTSGILLSTQGQANVVTDYSSNTTLAQFKCGKEGCGGRSQPHGCGGRPTALRDTPTTERVQRYPSSAPITAERLRDQLDVATKRIYDSLPNSGKDLALERVNKEPTRDKNEIVKSVRDELSQKNGGLKNK